MMRAIAIALAAQMFALVPAAQAQVPPVEAYGRLPAISDVAITPDGSRLAIAGFEAGRSHVRIVNIDTGAVERLTQAPSGTKLRGVSWADADRVLYWVSTAADPARASSGQAAFAPRVVEYWRVGVLSRQTGAQRYIEVDEDYAWAQTSVSALRAPIEGDPGVGRVVAWDISNNRLALFRVPLDRGRPGTVGGGTAQTVDILIDDRGGIGARVDVNQDTNRWRVLSYEGSRAREIMQGQSEFGEAPNLSGYFPDGRIAYSWRTDTDRERLFALDPASGQSEVIAEHPLYDIGGAILDPWTHRIVGVAWVEDMLHQRFFDADLQAAYERLAGRGLRDSNLRIMTWSRDRKRIVIDAEINHGAGGYYLYEPETDRLRPIGDAYPELRNNADIGIRQSITYRARDGQRVPAYLTLPADGERDLPLILLVHGGPHARDVFAFDWWASFLASRGYAVLQPNYRGSTGYGFQWFDAGRLGWGTGVMQTDVEDGVDALVRSGIADGERVCIVGASYGGYAALAGATLTPDRYRCAAAIAGVSDLTIMLREAERFGGGRRGMAAEWWTLSMGNRRENPEALRAISPAERAEDVTIPILLMHGVDDSVVPIAQTRLMRDRLQAAGKDVRYVEMQADDHWLSNAETRTQMLRELELFLSANLGVEAGAQR
jgi:dipeptidyl aminopeptidase/acylaminoacyl peptidase